MRSYVLGDFCIDASHRSLGLALTLQRACMEGLSGRERPPLLSIFPAVLCWRYTNECRLKPTQRLFVTPSRCASTGRLLKTSRFAASPAGLALWRMQA